MFNWECLFVHGQKRVILIFVCGWHQIDWKKNKHIDLMWKVLNRELAFEEPTSFIPWSCFLITQSQTMPNKQRYCGQLQSHVWIEKFRGRWLKNCHILRFFGFLHGLMRWKVMLRKVSSDIVSWQTGRINQSTKCLLHACEERQFKEKESKWLTSDGVHAFDLWKSDFCRF